MTPEHVKMIKGMVGKDGAVYLVFDSDQAGIKAAQRSIPIFEKEFLSARILVLPKGYDPDTFLREHGPDDFLKYADNALGMVPFIVEAAIVKHGLSLEGKIRIINDVKDVMASIQDVVARTLHIKQLSERLDIEESALLEKIRQATGRLNAQESSIKSAPKETFIAEEGRLELQVVGMMLCYPLMIPEIVGRNLLDCFEDKQLKHIANMVAEGADAEGEQTADLVTAIEDPQYRSLVAQLAITECHWDRQGCERLLTQFEARNKRRIRQDLQRQIESAERNNDMDLLSELLKLKQQQAAKGLIN